MVVVRGSEANFDFGVVMQGDGRKRVIKEGIAETVESGVCKTGGIITPAFEGGDDFFKEKSLQPDARFGIIQAISDRAKIGPECLGDEGRVGAVEDAHLAQGVGCNVGRGDDGSMLREGEIGTIGLDSPKGEGFATDEEGIDAKQRMGLGRAGHDAIREGVGPVTVAFDPIGEVGSALPSPGLFEHEFAELVAVGFDQFAGNDPRAGLSCFKPGLEAGEQFGGKGVGCGRFGRQRQVVLIEGDSGFSRVGENGREIGLTCCFQNAVPLSA